MDRTDKRGRANAWYDRRRGGFTLAETVAVVGLLIVLMGVAFAGVINVWRSMRQLEMDGTAKEIYVAAQNHLSMAESQGLLDLKTGSNPTFDRGSLAPGEKSNNANAVYYFMVTPTTAKTEGSIANPNNRSSVLSLMLPVGSIDDTVRLGGSYLVSYQPSTATVLDVFYTKEGYLVSSSATDDDCDEQYSALDAVKAEEQRLDRRKFAAYAKDGSTAKDITIGYYGGEDLNTAAVKFKAPTVEVENGDQLVVVVKAPVSNETLRDSYNVGKAESEKLKLKLNLIVDGQTSGKTAAFGLAIETGDTGTEGAFDETGLYRVYRVVLDDVTASGGSFVRAVRGSGDEAFIPGENLKIYAWVTSETVRATVARSAYAKTNSLFASGKGEQDVLTATYRVKISSMRHLLNLDTRVSGLDLSKLGYKNGDTLIPATSITALQTSDLAWTGSTENTKGFLQSIRAARDFVASDPDPCVYYATSVSMPQTTTAAGQYLPVVPEDYTLNYDGRAHVIKGVSVKTADGTAVDGNAGLFGTLASYPTTGDVAPQVANLELVSFNIAATGSAGALAGEVGSGVTVTNVLARNALSKSGGTTHTKMIKGATAGGLVGELKGAVKASAAAVYVEGADAAGGLVGSATSTTITDSYAGGHTKDGAYTRLASGEAHLNVVATSTSGAAGGLVGSATNTTIQSCYATCSAKAGTSGKVGGLVGSTDADSKIKNSYALGLVDGGADSARGAFVGSLGGATLGTGDDVNHYLDIINGGQATTTSAARIWALGDDKTSTAVEAIDGSVEGYAEFFKARTSDDAGPAIPYDLTLATYYLGSYGVRTIKQIDATALDTAYNGFVDPTAEASVIERQKRHVFTRHLERHYGDWPVPEAFVYNDVTGATPTGARWTPGAAGMSNVRLASTAGDGGTDGSAGTGVTTMKKQMTRLLRLAEEELAAQDGLVTSDDDLSQSIESSEEDAIAPEEGALMAIDAAQETLETDLACVDGTTYHVTLTYDESAGIPAGTKLNLIELTRKLTDRELKSNKNSGRPYDTERFVTRGELAELEDKLVEGLELDDDDYLLFDRFFDLTLTYGDRQIQPQAPVEVRIETSCIPETYSDVLEAAMLVQDEEDSDQDAGLEPTERFEWLDLTNETEEGEGVAVSFACDQLTELGLAGVMSVRQTREDDVVQVQVIGPRSIDIDTHDMDLAGLEEGLELRDCFYVQLDDAPSHGTTLWLIAQPQPGSDAIASADEFGSLVSYHVRDGVLVGEPSATGKSVNPVAFRADVEGMAVIWDSGYRTQTIEADDITLDGMMPEGTQVEAVDVSDDYDDLETIAQNAGAEVDETQILSAIAAYDITLDVDGEDYQPDEERPLTVSVTHDDIDPDKQIEVWHLLDDGTVEVISDVVVEGNTVSFEVTGFSVYIVVEGVEGDDEVIVTPRRFYSYHEWDPSIGEHGDYIDFVFTNDQGQRVSQQVVKDGERPVIPQPTSSETRSFAGWYEGHYEDDALKLDEEPYDFDKPITEGENEFVDLYAKYREYAYVIFHNQYDEATNAYPVAHTQRVELVTTGEGDAATTAGTVKVSDLSATYVGDQSANMAFYGWSYVPVQTPGDMPEDEGDIAYRTIYNDDGSVPEGTIEVEATTSLYPLFKSVHWLSFYTGSEHSGADYVPSRYYFAGDGPKKLSVPGRSGYTFGGWWTGSLITTTDGDTTTETVRWGAQITDAEGNVLLGVDDGAAYVSFGKLLLRADTTLYAQWIENTSAEYRSIIWKQRTSDALGLSDEAKTYEIAEIHIESGNVGAEVSVDAAYKTLEYEGYHFGRCDGSATIENDGSTVLNVYYDLSVAPTISTQPHTLEFMDSLESQASTSMPQSVDGIAYGTPLADLIISDPLSGRQHYEFDGWYADDGCAVRAFFRNNAEYRSYTGAKVLYDTMPDHSLTVYAGWKSKKYRVQIDPNYGELTGSASLWFNSRIDEQPIQEYVQTTRNYVPSSSGSYYYVKHDLSYYGFDPPNGADRHAYYTTDPGEATEDTTFEYEPNTYRYAGWYEVLEDGTEEPYVFGNPVDHDTYLKLHWKKVGSYYLEYDAGEGTLDVGDQNEALISQLDDESYADGSSVVVARSATPPSGFVFAGWRVRGNEGTVYGAGQTFVLNADYAVRASGRDVIYLDAVYTKVGTAQIVYDVNGGTIDADTVDAGSLVAESAQQNTLAPIVETATVTVRGLPNNSKFILSDGSGFSREGATLLGWSDTKDYDPQDEGANFYKLGGKYGIDKKNPRTLYAVWGVGATFHLNNDDANWGDDPWEDYVDGIDDDGPTKTKIIYLNTAVTEPTGVPQYTGDGNLMFYGWQTSSGTSYEFSRKVTGALHLYAYWEGPVQVPLHARDASTQTLVDKDEDWLRVPTSVLRKILVGTQAVPLADMDDIQDYLGEGALPPDYEYAFAAAYDAATALLPMSENDAVTELTYDVAAKCVTATYAAPGKGSEPLGDKEIYLVFYQRKALDISYQVMDSSGSLSGIEVASGAPGDTGIQLSELLGDYDVDDEVSSPLAWANTGEDSYTHYAYAIGDTGATTAETLRFISDISDSDSDRPALTIINSWQGFYYSTDDGATWTRCGYEPQLYVVYFAQNPTVIMLREQTRGNSAVVDTDFSYSFEVTQTTKTTTSVQRQRLVDGDWVNEGDSVATESETDPVSVFSGTYVLSTGKAQSAILFYDATTQRSEGDPVDEDGVTYRDVTTTTIVTSQAVAITQVDDERFTTTIAAKADGDSVGEVPQPNQWAYATTGDLDYVEVVFSNAHTSMPVEVHVALVDEAGIIRSDDLRADMVDPIVNVAIDTVQELQEALSPTTLFAGDTDVYAFGTILTGASVSADGDAITKRSMGIGSIGYVQAEGSDEGVYELAVLDEDGNSLGSLGSSEVYYLYYQKPQIRYVKENADHSLTNIRGALDGVVSEEITYGGSTFTMNGQTVSQEQRIAIPMDGFRFSQKGSGSFRMPPILDDETSEHYLSYKRIGAGPASVTSLDDEGLSWSNDKVMYLRVRDNALQYSFDHEQWENLLLSGVPTIYAIYTERGYDLQVSKTIDVSDTLATSPENAPNPLFTERHFTLTISSDAITSDHYSVEGYVSARLEDEVTTATETTPGTIVLDVVDGTKIKIIGLGRGDYTITESENEGFDLDARVGAIVGGSTTPAEFADDDKNTVLLTLDDEKKLDLTNSPKKLCKIVDNEVEHVFYTFADAITYVDDEMSVKTATIEMLTDYVVPAEDILEVPSGFDITLTTAEDGAYIYEGEEVATLTRTDALADLSMIVSDGKLSLGNIRLDGAGVEASKPLIASADDLSLGEGTSIIDAINSGNGGAIKATGGNIEIRGSITDCEAANGGAIHYSGSGTISMVLASELSNNMATSGDGGAIYATNGKIELSGSSHLDDNTAAHGKGGAIYAGNVLMTVDENVSISSNVAQSGGAIYAEAGDITISQTEDVDVDPPVISGNRATGDTESETTGDGGVIWVGTGSVQLEGGVFSGNQATSGCGGVVYAEHASVTVAGEADLSGNSALAGGVAYAESGPVTISGGSMTNNHATGAASDDDAPAGGGVVYAGSGAVTVSGGTITGNGATADGGAVYAAGGSITVKKTEGADDPTITSNVAGGNGGAFYAGTGTVDVSIDELSGNTATAGKGGAIYADSGAVTLTGTTMANDIAGSGGGAIYAGSGALTVTNATLSSNRTNTSDGGALYAGSGNVTVSGGSMSGNVASAGNGGALYVGSGVTTMSNTSLTGNTATAGNGGAIYLDEGKLTLTTVSATGNTATNGAAVFAHEGTATFDAGTYTGNTASAGGATGVGSADARLFFNGNVQVQNNTLGTGADASASNVYLDQDDDAIINIDTLGGSAYIGIHVPDALVDERSVPGARFAMYYNNTNADKIHNDRYSMLSVQSDTGAKKFYWANAIKVQVRYLASYANGFPPTVAGTTKYTNNTYYPEFMEGAISELAAELYTKYNLNLASSAVYGGAFASGATSYADYVTKLTWVPEESTWKLTKRDGTQEQLNGRTIIIYYAEPAYISIENNTPKVQNMVLAISSMTVNGSPVINDADTAGYGMVFAKNGAIRSALLPVTADDLQLDPGSSINLLIPGGQNAAYTIDGGFSNGAGESVRLRRTGQDETTLTLNGDGIFTQITGRTLNSASTYSIIFGDDKYICKVVDASGVEHPYSKISDAIAAIQATQAANPPYTLATAKKATIEMLVDYLLTNSDVVNIPQGYDITLTTAVAEGTEEAEDVQYPYTGEAEDGRATISRDSENTQSMFRAWYSSAGSQTTNFRLNRLVIDGKSVRGSSDGGAVATRYANVYINSVDFKNVYASNGGALLVMFNFDEKNTKTNVVTIQGTYLEVRNSDFTGCTSTTTDKSNRLGGGAIVTNASNMTLENCDFDTCTAVDQAGAVFHRVDSNYNSWTVVRNCTFTNCSANAAGGLELDSKTINVSDCTFNHCVARERNGGGFNVWPLNSGTTSSDCWVTVTGCTFNDCQLTGTGDGNGGGFRCAALYTVVNDCTFTNNQARYGGGFCVSNGNAKKCEVYGSSFERNTASQQGGGILLKAKEVVIGDYTYPADSELAGEVRHTDVKNCTSKNEGGGIYHDKNADNTSLTITNAEISGNRTQNSNKNGGGVFTNCRAVTIQGSAITDNTCTNQGGGVYAYSYTSLTIADSEISRNVASSNGGGVWFDADGDTNRAKMTLTIKGSTIDNNSSGGNGGGIYTLAKIVDIQGSATQVDTSGNAVQSSVSSNTAKIGGGIYHDRTVADSKLELKDASVSGNKAINGVGGGIRTNARELKATDCIISGNSATGNGGGIWYDGADAALVNMALTMQGCTMDGNVATGHGGGFYTRAKTVSVSDSTISSCTSKTDGGGICHIGNFEDFALTIDKTTIRDCASESGRGGGVYADVRSVTVRNRSVISRNSTIYSGGGIYDMNDGTNRMLIIDNSRVESNTAGGQGGGIYTKSQLTLRNDSVVTGNRLSTSMTGDAAGIYLLNNRTLFVGTEGMTTADDSSVYENYTSVGVASNLRLWEGGSGTSLKNDAASVFVYGHLSGEIRVVNANRVGTQFGSSDIPYPDGFSDSMSVFRADASTLHGVVDRTDSAGKKLIWAGPPIAKITDGEGNLLYMKVTIDGIADDPAIFDRLSATNYNSGNPSAYEGRTSAFGVLYSAEPKLYTKDGQPYTGSEYCIKMLVESFTSESNLYVPKQATDRTITLTTAGKNAAKEDGYPFEGRGTRATIVRGSGANNSSFLAVNMPVVLENIVLDGGSQNGLTGRTIVVGGSENEVTSLTLGDKSIVQNASLTGSSNNGAGVAVWTGALSIEGGIIRNCTSQGNGGAIVSNRAINFEMGSILQCSAAGKGGGIYQAYGTLTMSGGTISGCTADEGGGVFVDNNSKMNMSGGTIVGNKATTKGGGVAITSDTSKKPTLTFSQKPTVSGNSLATTTGSGASGQTTLVTCNVELDRDSNAVINTDTAGLANGAYIGVYVHGTKDSDNPDNETAPYAGHGREAEPFGTFVNLQTTKNLYCFVNDRNGLKGGLMSNDTSDKFIYWIKIFSLDVSKAVEASEHGTPADENEEFSFTVEISGNANVIGQANASDIEGEYGQMYFENDGSKAVASFTLKAGEHIAAENLSSGLTYHVYENLSTTDLAASGTLAQSKRFAAIPTDHYTGKVGENNRPEVAETERYVSRVSYVNRLPVCKITDKNGYLLYYRQGSYNVPAVYTELADAVAALSGTFYVGVNVSTSSSYNIDVNHGCHIEMMVPTYTLTSSITLPEDKPVTLTTAAKGATVPYPFQGTGNTATIKRGFDGDSLFVVAKSTSNNDHIQLTLTNITLDGAKNNQLASGKGGLVRVERGGKAAMLDNATLQNSRTSQQGGAIYVADGGTFVMSGGTIGGSTDSTRNVSVGEGAGIYLQAGSTLNLSGASSFGGGTNVSGNILYTNVREQTLVAQTNGGKNKSYTQPRQDIFLEEAGENPASIVVTGNLTGGAGTIWVWAAHENHYAMTKPFARTTGNVDSSCYTVFRNAQPDSVTLASDTYLTGSKGDNEQFVYWTGGYEVQFKKVDSSGNPLAGAKFKLYKNYSSGTCSNPLQQKGADVEVTSAANGLVTFPNVPAGVFYLQETEVPTGYTNGLVRDASGNLIPNVYVVVVGQSKIAEQENLAKSDQGILANITTEEVTAQRASTTGKQKEYVIFLLDRTSSETKAMASADVVNNGVMNYAAEGRKVILKKVETDTYDDLAGAVFTLKGADGSVIASGLTSGENGVFFVGDLPIGTYRLTETAAPSGHKKASVDYVVTVALDTYSAEGIRTNGVTVTAPTYTSTT